MLLCALFLLLTACGLLIVQERSVQRAEAESDEALRMLQSLLPEQLSCSNNEESKLCLPVIQLSGGDYAGVISFCDDAPEPCILPLLAESESYGPAVLWQDTEANRLAVRYTDIPLKLQPQLQMDVGQRITICSVTGIRYAFRIADSLQCRSPKALPDTPEMSAAPLLLFLRGSGQRGYTVYVCNREEL